MVIEITLILPTYLEQITIKQMQTLINNQETNTMTNYQKGLY